MIRRLSGALRRHFRRRRYQCIRAVIDVESQAGFVLDLGGGPASFFAALFPRPEQVVLLDIDYSRAWQARYRRPALHVIVADGTRLPLDDLSLDAAVCNSVIEHVRSPQELAAEIRRVAKSYFVQTPHKGFPLETHSFIAIPLYNWIPCSSLQRFICSLFGANYDHIRNVSYLAECDLTCLFPEAEIAYESVFALKKAFYIYRPAYTKDEDRTPGNPRDSG